jgi:hypothetical protein
MNRAQKKDSRLSSAGSSILRTGGSRILGLALIATSAVLYFISFITGFLPFEVASLASFVLGIILLAAELEPRVKLRIAADGMLGYVRTFNEALKALRVSGKATYLPRGGEVTMSMAQDGASKVELPPVGGAIYEEIVGELGEINQKGEAFFDLWVPRVLAENLSMADEVKISREGASVRVSMSKPFVRRLCIDPFVNANVCSRMGCPLAGAVAQALAATTAKDVQFETCTYDPKTQRAQTTLTEL